MTVADMDRYLPYLVERFITAGGVIDIAHIESLDEITDSPIVVNCAGLGAGPLADDPTLTGQWGMHVVIDNPGINAAFMEGPPGPHDWVAWMPHGDRILIGGTIDTNELIPPPTRRPANGCFLRPTPRTHFSPQRKSSATTADSGHRVRRCESKKTISASDAG